MRKKIYLLSPDIPCGTVWLVNCFLELGIYTYQIYSKDMWLKEEDHYVLHPSFSFLKKWLPSLTNRQYFCFDQEFEVEFSHEWPKKEKYQGEKIIYFVRDPRDAIYSMYKRINCKLSFSDYVSIPEYHTLLNQVDNWYLFNKSWLEHDDIKVVRFEDYRQDAKKTLLDVLDFIELEADEEAINTAIANSTFEQAVLAEQKYKESIKAGSDEQVINRSKSADNWRVLKEKDEDFYQVTCEIERKCKDVLLTLGYEVGNSVEHVPPNYYPNVLLLDFFRNIKLLSDIRQDEEDKQQFNHLFKFLCKLDAEFARKSKLDFLGYKKIQQSFEELSFINQFSWTSLYRCSS